MRSPVALTGRAPQCPSDDKEVVTSPLPLRPCTHASFGPYPR
jgi:hypothetical protein